MRTVEYTAPPILLMVYNRIDTLKPVFERIREVKPPALYVAADGPREWVDDDAENCLNVKNYIIKNVDWECDLHTLFRDKNVGVNVAILSAIDWFFDSVEYGIVLEDDCVPHPDFFVYCEHMRRIYNDDSRVMIVCGTNPSYISQEIPEPYYLSRWPTFQAWASWSRAWKQIDKMMSDYPTRKKELWSDDFMLKVPIRAKRRIFCNWDFAYYIKESHGCYARVMYSIFKNKGLGVMPGVNLVSNIGIIGIHGDWSNSPSVGVPTDSLKMNWETHSTHHPNITYDLKRFPIEMGFDSQNKSKEWGCLIVDYVKIAAYKYKHIHAICESLNLFTLYQKIKDKRH